MVVNSCERTAVDVNVPAEASNSLDEADTDFDNCAHRAFEVVSKLDHVRLALLRLALLVVSLPPVESRCIDNIFLK